MMKKMNKTAIFYFLALAIFLLGIGAKKSQPEPLDPGAHLKALFNSLDPHSLSQNLTFYELYPQTEEGKKALEHAWMLLQKGNLEVQLKGLPFPHLSLQPIISLITRQPSDPPIKLKEDELKLVDILSASFANRQLKGHKVWSEKELLQLPSEEVDLGRAILIYQFENADNPQDEIRQYETLMDLMALQIFARLPKEAAPLDKVKEINRFIFQEMQFRFPPHSLYAKDIDLYTFLPSVLDSRQGVCLGVSTLYLCLAQRLGLTLEIITPPGHIYIRLNDQGKITNIETTARGINLPDETYLNLNTHKLEKRSLKEVVGMAFFNQASLFSAKADYQKAVELYERALLYCPDDHLLQMLLGLHYLFNGNTDKGKKILAPLRNFTFDYAISPETLAEDYLEKRVDVEGLKTIFSHVDETRDSVLKKQRKLQETIKRYPKFRAGLLQLAVTYLQLERGLEALTCLEKYHIIDPNDPTVEYYLSAISAERLDYQKAWLYLKRAEMVTQTKQHHPKALKALRHHLRSFCPPP